MKWLELSVQSPPEFVEPLSQIFHRYGHGGVAVEQDGGFNPDEGEAPPTPDRVTLKTYIPIDSTTEERRNRIDLGVRLVAHVSPVSPLLERVLDEEEWQNSWREHFHVLRIGKRIVVCPTWRDYDPAESVLSDPSESEVERSDIVITLDPGMAFGTGHHPTTRMCLELIEDLVKPGMDVLDVGCGSGILSIAAAKLGARSAFGLEIDSVAIGVAVQNTRDNDVAHKTRIAQGGLPHPSVPPAGHDLAIANISSKVVAEIAGDLVRAVRPGGKVIASGILTDNKDTVVQKLESAEARIEGTVVDGDWVTLVASVP